MNAPTPRALPVINSTTAVAIPPQEQADDELRQSNTVADFKYNRWLGLWYTVRLFFVLPLMPLWPFLIAKEAKDWSIARNYFGTIYYCFRTIGIHIRHGSFVRLFKYNIIMGPEETKRRIDKRRGACTRCAKCCRQYDCIFLDQDPETEDFTCKIYQTNYWYYGTCGRYPVDQRDIDDHACPGFSFPEGEAA
jgi:hypothetical protein